MKRVTRVELWRKSIDDSDGRYELRIWFDGREFPKIIEYPDIFAATYAIRSAATNGPGGLV